MRRRAFLSAGLALTAAGCSTGPRGGGEAGGGFVGGDGSWSRVAPAERRPAPAISGETLDGKPLALADYRGRVVVVNVWGSWCTPCRKEGPELARASAQTAKLAQFVGLNTRDLNQAQALAFLRAAKITYPNLYDPDGDLLLLFEGNLPPQAIPSTLLIDPEGRMAARLLGPVTELSLVQVIHDVAEGR